MRAFAPPSLKPNKSQLCLSIYYAILVQQKHKVQQENIKLFYLINLICVNVCSGFYAYSDFHSSNMFQTN